MSHEIKVDLEFEDSTKTSGKYLVVDIETTGLPINKHASPEDFKNWPHVVQIGWILFDDEHKLIEHSTFYLKQSVVIPMAATKIHGITTAMMLEKGIEPSNVYTNFKKAIDNTEYIISHNIDFDIPILHCEFLRNDMQWDFPHLKMFCTMWTGTAFCKIPVRNGGYKFPTLEELYQKCFFPDADVGSIRGMHSAIIDAGMTAKCFFKLKELGPLAEFEINTIMNSLSNEQFENNFQDIQDIRKYEEYTDDYDVKWFVAEIKHLGLGTFRVLKDKFEYGLKNKVEAQFQKWDEQWAKNFQKKKLQTDKEASLNLAEERTRNAQDKQKQIDDLLICTLGIDDKARWDSVKNTKKFKVPNPKNNLNKELNKIAPPTPLIFREPPKPPSHLSILAAYVQSRKEVPNETIFQKADNDWKKSVDEINSFNANLKKQHEQKLKEIEKQKQAVVERFNMLEKDWEREKEAYNNKTKKENNEKIEKFKQNHIRKNAEAVVQNCEIVLSNSQYPETFPKNFDFNYNPDSKMLIVDYALPAPDDLPTLTSVKYIAKKKRIKGIIPFKNTTFRTIRFCNLQNNSKNLT